MNYSEFKTDDGYLLWGGGRWGRLFLQFFPGFPVKAFIDSDLTKQNTSIDGIPILSLDDALYRYPRTVIIITILYGYLPRIQLMERGLVERRDFYTLQDFVPRWGWHSNRECCVAALHFASNNTCSYSCDNCRTYIPYAKKRTLRSLKTLKSDVDLAFKKIDRVILVCSSSGEPLMHPDIAQLYKYISDNYSSRYLRILVVTNSFIVPDDDTIDILSKCKNIEFSLSDYSERIQQQGVNQERLIDKLKANGIGYIINTTSNEDYWYDFGNPNIINETRPELLVKRFSLCSHTEPGVIDGKLVYCMQEAWAHLTAETPIYEDDCFDLTSETDDDEKFIKLIMREPPKGYLDFCARCNGTTPIVKPI